MGTQKRFRTIVVSYYKDKDKILSAVLKTSKLTNKQTNQMNIASFFGHLRLYGMCFSTANWLQL